MYNDKHQKLCEIMFQGHVPVVDLDTSRVTARLGMEPIVTPLFQKPPSIRDINQGSAKDCLFLSLLASYMYNFENRYQRFAFRVEDIIKDNLKDVIIFNVREVKKYRIKKELPRGRHFFGFTPYSRSSAWVRFLELYIHCSYGTIAPAPERAVYEIFGFITEEDLIIKLDSIHSIPPVDAKSMLEQALNKGPVLLQRPSALNNTSGIYAGHAYGLLDVEDDGNIVLFNPLPHSTATSFGYWGDKKLMFKMHISQVLDILTNIRYLGPREEDNIRSSAIDEVMDF